MRVLGVIPARGGSRRVPHKNIRLLCGSPLISYTIRAAQKAKSLTDWVVSTEDPGIETIALSYGAHVLKRPDYLAGDEVTSGAVCKHALEAMELENEPYDMVVLLHPTSPIRDPKHIDEAVSALAASELNHLASVREIPCKSHRNVGCGFDFTGNIGVWNATPDSTYMLNASIYCMKAPWFKAHDYPTHVWTPCVALRMDRYHSLDIDEEIDIEIAELYLRCLGQ